MTSPPKGPDWTALARFLAGEATPDEAEAVRRWIDQDPALAALIRSLERHPGTEAEPSIDVEAALRRTRARFGETPVVDLEARRSRRSTVLRYAAALFLVGGAALLWRLIRAPVPPPDPVTYATGIGQTDSLHLGDGTLAVLGPTSTLTVLAGYGITSRGVELEGQAFFDVPHDPTRPFRVRAGAAAIEDLGTRFTVRTRQDEVHVMVESGSVRLEDTSRAARRSLILRAGQAGSLPRNRTSPVATPATEADVAWLSGHLIFDNAPLARVRDDLRRWYGIELVFADSALAARHLSARFAGESPAQVLQVLELTLGVTIERRGDTAIVRTARAPRRGTP